MKIAIGAAIFVILSFLFAVWVGRAQSQSITYACVIASMGKQIFYKSGFVSWTNCMAYCSYNANIRSLGGQLEIRYNCPPERW